MTIRNQIRVASVKEYDSKGYATIILKQGESFFEESDRTVPEVMTVQLNTASQKLPDTGVDCLIAFDDTGDPYVLGTIGSENQPIPEPTEPGTMIAANVTDDPLAQLKMFLTELGKLAGEKTSTVYGPIEIVTILIDAIDLIATSTVPAGGGSLSNAAFIAVEVLKLTEFKKV